MTKEIQKRITQQEAIEVIDTCLKSSIFNDETRKLLQNLKVCLQYEIDHNACVWHNRPADLGDNYAPDKELHGFFAFLDENPSFVLEKIANAMTKIANNINAENANYNLWGAETRYEDYDIIYAPEYEGNGIEDYQDLMAVRYKYAIDKSVFDKLNGYTVDDPYFLVKASNSVPAEKFFIGFIDHSEPHSDGTQLIVHSKEMASQNDFYPYMNGKVVEKTSIIEIDEDTICRCLGFKDINGNYVFENHYVKHYNSQNGKDDKTSFELGKIFFDKASLSWKRTVEYIQENGQEVVVSRTLVKSEPATVQMSPHNDYELLGYAPNHSIIEYVQNR